MFISKKKFKEAIEIAKKETMERMWEEQHRHDFERETYQEIERIRCEFGKHNFTIDERLDRLEKAVFNIKKTPCNGGEICGESES